MSSVCEISPAEYESMLRLDFSSFIERSFYELNPQTPFYGADYIDLMASFLEKSRLGKSKRLVINLPPRGLKSHAASVAFVAWHLGHDPSKQIICASYGQDLADKHARDCRTLMMSSFYRRLFPATVLSPVKQSVPEFATTAHGMRMSTSVGGVLTGRGADVIILDDPLKPEDALSESQRKRVNDWYSNTLLSRLNSKSEGVIIIVAQRLHQDDLVGEVLGKEHWDVLCLPAIAQEDERHIIESPLGARYFTRRKGDLLHPERDSLTTLLGIKAAISDYNFQSQYQQSPIPREGGLIKRDWLRYYEPQDRPDKFSLVIQSWDTANKSGEFNDYSVCTTWGYFNDRFYLLDVFRERLDYPDLRKAAIAQWKMQRPSKVVIEDRSSGMSLIQDLRSEGIFSIEPYKPTPGCDKIMRLAAQSAKFEQGKVFLPASAPWLDDFVLEITGVPGTKYDDQADSTSQALDYLSGPGGNLALWAKLGAAS